MGSNMFHVSMAETPEAKAIWAAVEQAAAGVPEWVKPHVTKAANAWAERIRQLASAASGGKGAR